MTTALGLGLGLPFRRGGSFTPASLFAAGEQGAWYDPSDYSTLFQDVAGTTPVTGVEQFVRLMLDKSKGLALGPELATGGTFDSGITGWTNIGANATLSWDSSSGGRAQITSANAGTDVGFGLSSSVTVSSTSFYEVSVTVTNGDSSARNFYIGFIDYQFSVNAGATRSITVRIKSITAGANQLILRTAGAFTVGASYYVDNYSVKLLPGNHATAPSDPARPILRARYNLLTYSEQFDNAAYVQVQATVTPNATTAPNGTLTADKLVENTATAGHDVRQTVTTVVTPITISCYCKAAERDAVLIGDLNLNLYAIFKLTGAGSVLAASSATSTQITALSNGWYLCVVNGTAAAGARPYGTRLCDAAGNTSYTGDGVSGLFIWGFDIRVTNDALNQPAYQRVAAATDYDTAGFLPYLEFNGSTWSMSTSAIDFSATDKMTVFAGVRKLSDAAATNYQALVELSAAFSNGAFALYTSAAVDGRTAFYLKGNATAGFEPQTYNAPLTMTMAVSCDIAQTLIADELLPRINGVLNQTNQVNANAGTGNFGNYPMFIGARNNASNWFNGRLYSLTVVGRAVNSGELAAMEAYVNQKTAAY